jgi:L-tartrate/succinate antiporter
VRWRAIAPVAVGALIALSPVPAGLASHAWHFFAIFAAVIAGLVFAPIPGGAVGLMGVTLATVLAPSVLFGPDQLAQAGFRPSSAAVSWALSGFSDATVWLIFAAYMFALGYEKTGLGRRIALVLVKRLGGRTLTLGYAVALADLSLAPFTPSNTARSGGAIYPVIRNLPPLYGSLPNDSSSRRIGSYLMWVAMSTVCVTSSLFLTGLAPNLLAIEMIQKITGVEIRWAEWFFAFAPAGFILLLLVPVLTYWLYPPDVKESREVPAWAASELEQMGHVSRAEITLAVLVGAALVLWIFGGAWINATAVALGVICLMLVTGVFSWSDVAGNAAAWSTLAWFATLVAMADGLNRVGFITWFARGVAGRLEGLPVTAAMVALLVVFFAAHYFCASLTAHTTALLPVMLAAGSAIPGLPMRQYALLLSFELGLMGILTPYATGPGPIYQGSGYLPPVDFWRLGLIFGSLFLAVLLVVGVPWTMIVAAR